MGIGDEAFVGALRRADGAPDLCEGNKEEAGVTVGVPEEARLALSVTAPHLVLRPPGVRRVSQVGKEDRVGSCVPHPSILYCSGLQMSSCRLSSVSVCPRHLC